MILLIKKSMSDKPENDSSLIKLTENSPHPEKTNDYKFHEYIARRPEFIIENYYKMLKESNFYVKPEFEKAIKEKLLKGEYKNPINFETYFGKNFSYIAVGFSSFYYDSEISYYLEACYIKNDSIAAKESFLINPPSSIFGMDDKSQTILPWDLEKDLIYFEIDKRNNNNDETSIILNYDSHFKEEWNTFKLKSCFESNLLVLWKQDFKILVRTLFYSGVKEFKFNYIILKEIAESKKLPNTVDGLLKHFDIEKDKEFATNLSSIYAEFGEKFSDIDTFVQTISIDEE